MRRRGGVLIVSFALATALAAPAPAVAPDDPLFDACPEPNCVGEQWDLMSDGRGISADSAWHSTRGEGVVVAVIDTGANFAHEDLVDRWWTNPGETGGGRESNGLDDDGNGYVDDWRGWDFYQDDNDPTDGTADGHGTGRAGTVAAEQGNGVGISGVAPDARVMVLRAGDTFVLRADRLARAIRYAADNGARVVNMSVGTITDSTLLREAVAHAEAQGVVLVAAMANEFSTHPNVPTVYDQVVGVGAIVPDTSGTGAATAQSFTVKAGYSNYGPIIDLVAPSDAYTTSFGGGYGKGGGTSTATPHVAGVAALVLAAAADRGLDLSAREVVSILRASAEDLTAADDEPANGVPYGYRTGWDRFTGWGRVDASAAVAMAAPGQVPPVADINSPEWFAYRTARTNVRGAVSARTPGPYTWVLSIGKGGQPGRFTRLAGGAGTTAFTGVLGKVAAAGLADGLYTLRLRVTDANGNVGEDRQAFRLERDADLLDGFPVLLGGSGTSAQPADLAGTARPEIVVADADGLVHAFRGDGTEVPGWPVAMEESPGAAEAPFRAGFVALPAVGDLDGAPGPEVVAGGLDGRVYAWHADGSPVAGWPVGTIDAVDPAEQAWEPMILSSPALVDLDGEPGLEVVEGAGDGRVHAWHADGSPVAGWPVLLDDPAVPGVQAVKVVSSPAVGDLDGDGSIEVVIGSAEHHGDGARVYALEPGGTLRPGWPVTLAAFAAGGFPLLSGVPQSPVLADVDGDGTLEVGVAGLTGRVHLIRADGTEYPPVVPASQGEHFLTTPFGPGSNGTPDNAVATMGNLAFGDVDRDGGLDLVAGLAGQSLLPAGFFTGRNVPFQHLLAAFEAKAGLYLDAFPRVVEDWMFLTVPILADVDGDGAPEAVIGSGEGVLHAFRADGTEPTGWPKPVGQWLQASAAAADLAGTPRTEVVAVTRTGLVLVYATDGRASGRDWPSARHDPANTGRLGG